MSEHDTTDRDEARVRAGFEALRDHDELAAPPFGRTWAAAAAASRPRPALRSWLLATATASVLVVALGSGVVFWAMPGSAPKAPAATATGTDTDRALAVRVASLRAEPLAFLDVAPTPGVLGGGGWFASKGRVVRAVEASW